MTARAPGLTLTPEGRDQAFGTVQPDLHLAEKRMMSKEAEKAPKAPESQTKR